RGPPAGEGLVDARPAAVAGTPTFVAAAAAIEARAVGAGDAERAEVGRRRGVGYAARRADAPDEPLGEHALEHGRNEIGLGAHVLQARERRRSVVRVRGGEG